MVDASNIVRVWEYAERDYGNQIADFDPVFY